MQEVEELVKSQYHQNVDCGTIYMTKEPGSLMNCQEENKSGKRAQSGGTLFHAFT